MYRHLQDEDSKREVAKQQAEMLADVKSKLGLVSTSDAKFNTRMLARMPTSASHMLISSSLFAVSAMLRL